jgi:predicted dehydrogenase
MDFPAQWDEVPDNQTFDNGFKVQWEDFIRHVVEGAPWRADLFEAAKGVQLAELATRSWHERRWVAVPDLVAEAGAARVA